MKKEDVILYTCVVFIMFLAGIWVGLNGVNHKVRQEGAMDVYRGNTKLQYTIVDSVKVDSCVIFVNK